MLNYIHIKNFWEWVFFLTFLPIIFTVFILTAFFCLINIGGDIFYIHHRIGKNGKKISIIKFRTMSNLSNDEFEKFLNDNIEVSKAWHSQRKLKNDPRIIPFGNFLRKSKLDEIPQFINFLTGELSLIGPRPITNEEILDYFTNEEAQKLLSIKPGISGLWQTSKNAKEWPVRKSIELSYIDNINFILDIKILVKTLIVPFYKQD